MGGILLKLLSRLCVILSSPLALMLGMLPVRDGPNVYGKTLNRLVKTVSHLSWAAGQASEMEGWSGMVIWEALNYDEHCTVVVVIPLPP